MTTCCIINALGSAIPTAMTFSRVHVKQRMTLEAPAATLGLATPTGWLTAELFSEVTMHFIKYSNASQANPVLLILDNRTSHLSIPLIDLAKDNGVHMFTLHPHCTHKLQPLVVAVFGPFKAYYAAALNAELMHRSGESLTIYDTGRLVNIACARAMTPRNIISGFRRKGIFL